MTTEVELEAKRKEAFELYHNLQLAIKNQGKLYLIIGQTLKKIRDEKTYNYLGEGGFDSFQQFLNNAEIGFRPATAYLYIRLYEYYIERLKLAVEEVVEVPMNRLMRLLPALKQKTDKESIEIVQNFKTLTNFDFDKELKEKKLETERPVLFKDKETGLYIFEFSPVQVLRIVNKQTDEIIYEKKITE